MTTAVLIFIKGMVPTVKGDLLGNVVVAWQLFVVVWVVIDQIQKSSCIYVTMYQVWLNLA
jgi:hypothetical protein